LGITDPAEIEVYEAAALDSVQKGFYTTLDMDHRFTIRDLLHMHKSWLGQLYAFAGKLRSVDIGKDGFQFASVQFLPSNLDYFERTELAKYTPCKVKSREECAEALATVHGEFIMLHPFREGNGRLGRWLADSMALQADMPPPNYGFFENDTNGKRAIYLRAVKKAVLLDRTELTQFFYDALGQA
jgi:cell filamentation protein